MDQLGRQQELELEEQDGQLQEQQELEGQEQGGQLQEWSWGQGQGRGLASQGLGGQEELHLRYLEQESTKTAGGGGWSELLDLVSIEQRTLMQAVCKWMYNMSKFLLLSTCML